MSSAVKILTEGADISKDADQVIWTLQVRAECSMKRQQQTLGIDVSGLEK
ncbi:MAG: hypothetical protein ACLTR6_06590 [Clostridium fessum]